MELILVRVYLSCRSHGYMVDILRRNIGCTPRPRRLLVQSCCGLSKRIRLLLVGNLNRTIFLIAFFCTVDKNGVLVGRLRDHCHSSAHINSRVCQFYQVHPYSNSIHTHSSHLPQSYPYPCPSSWPKVSIYKLDTRQGLRHRLCRCWLNSSL